MGTAQGGGEEPWGRPGRSGEVWEEPVRAAPGRCGSSPWGQAGEVGEGPWGLPREWGGGARGDGGGRAVGTARGGGGGAGEVPEEPNQHCTFWFCE